MASIVMDGKFTYIDDSGNAKQFDIATKKIVDAPEKKEWQKTLEEYDYVCFPNEGVILLVEYNNYSYKHIGFINKNKQVFLSENY